MGNSKDFFLKGAEEWILPKTNPDETTFLDSVEKLYGFLLKRSKGVDLPIKPVFSDSIRSKETTVSHPFETVFLIPCWETLGIYS